MPARAPTGPRATSSRDSRPRPPRGGIQKRRAPGGPIRTDTDGDFEMDRPGNDGGAGSSRRAGRAVQAINRHLGGEAGSSLASRVSGGAAPKGAPRGPRSSGPLSWIKVSGLMQSKAASNIHNGLRDLVSFLERKSTSLNSHRRQIVIKKSRLDGDDVFVAVGEDDVDDMLRTNKTQFAGTIITVVRSDERPSSSHGQSGGVSASAQETKAKLQDILSKRFDPSLKLLKLDFLSTDEELVRLGMFETKDRAEKTFQVFMVILDDLFKSATSKREGIESITVANNGIDHVKQIGALANTFPDIKNLELAGNALPSMAALEPWKGRFRELTMINVAGNPLANDPAHREHLMRWFPRLQLIDGVQVRTPEEAAAAANAGKPRPIPQFGLDFRDANGVGESFLLDFFVGYDTNRPALVAKYYDDATQFSLAVDTASVRDPNGPPIMPWGPYLKYSRNLQKVTHPSTRVQRLLKGATHILDLWKMLPSTSHPDIKLELSKYIVDCHIVPGLVDPSGGSEKGVDGMIITVHGEFDEQDQKANLVGKRSFSRTFILGPGLPGRNPIRVVNDMWTLRAAKALPVVVGGGGGGGGGDAQAAVPEQQQQPAVQPGQTAPAIPAAEHEQKQALIAELCRQTGMTAMYSEMCLGEVGWDLARGVAIFNEKRPLLPPDAFMAQN